MHIESSARVRGRVLTVGIAVALLVGLAACGGDIPGSQPTVESSRRSTSANPPTPDASESATAAESRNDLATLPLKRSVTAGQLSVSVEYNTPLAIKDWAPSVPKPILVKLTAVNRANQGQNIYLLRATADVTASGQGGFVDRPAPTIDAANITPGFIVKSPSTYNQIFNLPAVDESAEQLSIQFTYELVVQVSKGRDPGDYSKQVATDTIAVPVTR